MHGYGEEVAARPKNSQKTLKKNSPINTARRLLYQKNSHGKKVAQGELIVYQRWLVVHFTLNHLQDGLLDSPPGLELCLHLEQQLLVLLVVDHSLPFLVHLFLE